MRISNIDMSAARESVQRSSQHNSVNVSTPPTIVSAAGEETPLVSPPPLSPKEREKLRQQQVSTSQEVKNQSSNDAKAIESDSWNVKLVAIGFFGLALVLFFWIGTTDQPEGELYFPSDFTWGSATSSYQVEGAAHEDGRALSIWDTFCEDSENCNGDNGDVACDHYHRIKSDVELMKSLGLKAYRFSIAWPRILPNGNGVINQAGIDFYNELIDELLANGIVPWVTLYHWDLPQVLHDKYSGWLSRDIVDDFGYYAQVCFDAFGDRVKHWITINESWTVAVNGYNNGVHAPGYLSNPAFDPYVVGHHLILAHARAVKIYRTMANHEGGMIGISNSGDFRYPRRPERDGDIMAAQRAMEFQLGWFCDPIWIGDYPQVMRDRLGDRLPVFTMEEQMEILGSSDFFGLNHYSTLLASAPSEVPTYGGYWADINVNFSHLASWKQNAMEWSIVPEGCLEILKWIDKRYNHPIIYMTENGSSEPEPDLETALQDYGRRDYFEGYIRACREAIRANVNLKGYFAWSLMDNFEWQFGYAQRFGMCYVDFDTMERTPKLTAKFYRETIRANGGNIPKE